jgi:hypothetical protein
MNQIILIGEVKKVVKLSEHLSVSIVTKDYQKANVELTIIVENGYQNEMVQILKKKPLIAVKCGLRIDKQIGFIAEKMSVLKLTEEESKES